MISFIVIGKNEGWKLSKCLESITFSMQENKIVDYEVVYVDSNSLDDSIKRAFVTPKIKVYKITGTCNAAIARNIGGKEARGEILFFLDGDMVLNSKFVSEAINLVQKGYKFISGQVKEHFYDSNWNFLGERIVFSKKWLNRYNYTNGGAFIITADLWNQVNGMKTKYTISEDIDLTYRLIRKGYPIYRSALHFVTHHTIQYNYNTSLKKEIINFKKYLFRGLIIREHFFNLRILYRNLRINYSLAFLFLGVFLSAIYFNPMFLIPYLLIVILRSYRYFVRFKKVIKSGFILNFFKYIFIDFMGIVGLIVFYPSPKHQVYIPMKDCNN